MTSGALAARGVATRAGQVLLALAGDDAGTAADVITGLGLDHQVVHNRGAAVILPAGVRPARPHRSRPEACRSSARRRR